MTTTERTPLILRMFWHRSRKCGVPRTSREIGERIDLPSLSVADECKKLAAQGLLRAERFNSSECYFAPTESGVRMARQMWEAGV